MPRYEHDRYDGFFEVERDGSVVWIATGDKYKSRRKKHEYPDEDTARFWAGKLTASRTYGMRLVGPSRVLDGKPVDPPGSTVLAEEYFATANDRFVDEILRVRAGQWLAAFAQRWYADKRPWARNAMLAYVLRGCDEPEHKGLVKRLYKLVEAANDDVAVAHFMVAFDQLGNRLLVQDPYEDLRSNPEIAMYGYSEADLRTKRFSIVTRQYLKRRAYRYFRRMAFRDPARYVRCIMVALPHYRDEALASPAQLLDAWGLLHALYGKSDALVRDGRVFKLEWDKSLADLQPAPRWPGSWKLDEHFPVLLAILATAQSRTVRNWVGKWLRTQFTRQLAKLPYATVKRLLFSPHEEVQVFGAELFGKLEDLAALPVTEWIELLSIENLEVAPVIASVVAKHVSPARLSLEQCIALATSKIAPVAQLGLQWAREKKIATEDDLRTIAKITRAGVAQVRSEGTAWATSIVTSHPKATPEHLRDLCDAPFADAREHALAAVAQKPELSPPTLWFALTESPYPDVRDVVIDNAKKWREAAPPKTLRHVWSSAMLAVHRGAAAKRRVPKQIAERITTHPAEAGELLPILGVALRSVRPPERAAALAALARALRDNAELRALAARLLPELVMSDQVSS